MVRLAAAACRDKASCFLPCNTRRAGEPAATAEQLEERERERLLWLQRVAVAFGGRALAGLFLHMVRSGIYSRGMPDLTMVRAWRPVGCGDGMEGGGMEGGGMEVVRGSEWPTHAVTPEAGPVILPLTRSELTHCAKAASRLVAGAMAEVSHPRPAP